MSEATEEDGIREKRDSLTAGIKDRLVEFDRKKYNKLRMAYNQALAKEKDEFKFQGLEYVTPYAKYLLEYLDDHLSA